MTENREKNKILYVITKSNFGGAQKYVFDLVTGLPTTAGKPARWEGVVAFGGSGFLGEKLALAGVRTIAIPKLGRDISVFGDIAVFFSLIKLFLRERPSVAHLNSSKIGGLGALAGRIYNFISFILRRLPITDYRLPRLKIVFTAHGWAFNEPRGFLQKVIIKFVSWITVLLSHTVIAVSEKDYKQSAGMLFVGGKVRLIHNGIGKLQFIARDKAREILLGGKASKLGGGVIWVGVVAELTKNKGLEYAIKAMEIFKKNDIKNVALVIIGEGVDKFKLANMIKEKRLGGKVFLIGSRNDASKMLTAFDIFLFPSVKEGLPYALLEAGMAGLPVIASNVGGIPEIIDDMKSGILARAGEPLEIYKALVFLVKNENKMKEFGVSLRGKVEKEFSLKKMVKETVEVYKL